MSEIGRRPAGPEELTGAPVTCAVLSPWYSTFSIDDNLIVAEVWGATVRLYDSAEESETLVCATPEAAREQALHYAWSFVHARRAMEDGS